MFRRILVSSKSVEKQQLLYLDTQDSFNPFPASLPKSLFCLPTVRSNAGLLAVLNGLLH